MINPPLVDSHAHVWDRTCAFVDGARYNPDYEATIDTYLKVLDAQGIARAVLVQPSFLGTDNRYLLECLRAHPDRLRGIVVLSFDASDAELDDLQALGVIGVRFNLVGKSADCLETVEAGAFLNRIVERDWWAELQVEGDRLAAVLKRLEAFHARIMIDHFGKPTGESCPGHSALLAADPARFSIKLSAPYRQVADDLAPLARDLIRHFGAARCLWGSDWPWTGHEGHHTYRDTIRWVRDWLSDEELDLLRGSSDRLLGFE